jgi:signal peptidase II
MSEPTRSYRMMFLFLALFGFVADEVTKYVAFRTLVGNGEWSGEYDLVPGWFKFLAQTDPQAESCDCYFVKLNGPIPPRVNHGALFGLGGKHENLANIFFAAVSAIAAIGITYWGLFGQGRRDRLLSFALGLILSGTLGNLFDRIVFGGVRDFLYFYKIDWPVFNVADCALVCGAGILLYQALFLAEDETHTPKPVPPSHLPDVTA